MLKKTFLKDYMPPSHLINSIYLHFDIQAEHVDVTNSMCISNHSSKPLVLNGINLELLSILLNGDLLDKKNYTLDEQTLTLNSHLEEFKLDIKTRLYPALNTSLEGLYLSDNLLSTQCEAQGFRRITYFPDRPDYLTRYKTSIEADKDLYPVLLSNGNLVSQKNLINNRHIVTWEDPYPKPCYLFAMVAGDLVHIEEEFQTKSGKNVSLKIFVDKGNEKKCSYAMSSLINAMKWDEERFNLECDLDHYSVVAVQSFNMGAMENKGLNIFNANYVLATPQSATDSDFKRIEGVIGHEYFHNWTGNRITCRDWFQLSLKEGLTVFRDQEFSSDMQSSAVQRIEDVEKLRFSQFPEDSGPMSHPVKPQSYIAMDNFYTATIYDKGAELVRMIHTFIGEDAFQKGMGLYISRHDGQAVTIDDFIQSMADASAFDFNQFKRWYDQAGTPKITIKRKYDIDDKNVEYFNITAC